MNQVKNVILVSLGLTLLVSVGIGYALSDVLGFLQGTILVFILQLVGFYFYNSKNSQVKAQIEEQYNIVVSELLEKSYVNVICPCGNVNEKTLFFELEDTNFTCEKCSSRYRVEMVLNPVLLTEPANLENAFNVIKKKELP